MVAGYSIQTLVTQKHKHEFFDELRKILSNGEVESLSDKAALRLILAALAELYDVSDKASEQSAANARVIKELQKSSLVLRYREAFKSRPYTTVLITLLVVTYIATWVIHTWSEFSLIWLPIYDFVSSIGG